MIRRKWGSMEIFFSDYNSFIAKKNESQQHRLNSQILLLMHSLEKGMGFQNVTHAFGEEKAKNLCLSIIKYMESYGRNNICVIAINILSEYLKAPYSTPNTEVRNLIMKLIVKNLDIIESGMTGVKPINIPPIFDKEKIMEFFISRNSVRDYSDLPITDEEILSAMTLAATTPTACNRQAARIHVFREEGIMKKLIDNQLGGQNWCENAMALFVITIDKCYFGGGYERYQGFIDGGLYAMNFVMGLHLNHIATCFKMFIREPKREAEFKKIANISVCEVPIVLVLAGHYKKGVNYSPKSVRLHIKPINEKGEFIP